MSLNSSDVKGVLSGRLSQPLLLPVGSLLGSITCKNPPDGQMQHSITGNTTEAILTVRTSLNAVMYKQWAHCFLAEGKDLTLFRYAPLRFSYADLHRYHRYVICRPASISRVKGGAGRAGLLSD